MDLTSLAPDPANIQAFRAYLQCLPYDKRWDPLRPVLEPLFHTESIRYIARMISDRYGFNATETQYKYRFNKVWKLAKNVPEAVKHAAIRKGLQRAKEGRQSIVKWRGRTIPASRFQVTNSIPAQLASLSLRDLFTFRLDQLETFGRYTPFGSSLLLAWNMPYGTPPQTHHVFSPQGNPLSPFNLPSGTTPSDIEMTTPSDHAMSPPGAMTTGCQALTLSPAIREHRLRLFLEGKLPQLLQTLSQEDRSDLSNYLSDFWHFSFATAQNWSPYATSEVADEVEVIDSGMRNANVPPLPFTTSNTPADPPEFYSDVPLPSQVCGWAIHIGDLRTIAQIQEPDISGSPTRDQPHRDVVTADELMRTALESSSFSNVTPSSLAVPVPDLIDKLKPHKHDLLSEAFSFAIMGRNLDLLRQLIDKVFHAVGTLPSGRHSAPDDFSQLFADMDLNLNHALHLATTYLDGASTCCLIVKELLGLAVEFPQMGLGNLLNDNNHTLIDSIFLTILRSHSRTSLATIDPQLSKMARYRGQEVDICGRWSATSACFKDLIVSGEEQIPWSWKHKFCRTAVQVVCHAFSILCCCLPFLKEQDSGLFVQRCTNPDCGRMLQLSPLHAIVIVAYHLARYGARDEDLFGVLACYLCLIDAGVDPLLRKEISASQLLDTMNDGTCTHSPQTAAELAREILFMGPQWDVTESCHTGFAVLLAVMEETEQAITSVEQATDQLSDITGFDVRSEWPWRRLRTLNDYDLVDPSETLYPLTIADQAVHQIASDLSWQRERLHQSFEHRCGGNGAVCSYWFGLASRSSFANSLRLGHVWAAVQAEFSSSEGRGMCGQHLSSSFNMLELLSSLKTASNPQIGHLRNESLRAYCACGRFQRSELGLATREQIFEMPSHNLGDNVDAWARTSFISGIHLGEIYELSEQNTL